MGVTDFDTKVAAGAGIVGEPYRDADGEQYLPLLRQPVLVFAASGAKLATVARRAREREAPFALYTAEMFATGHDDDNRAAVEAVATEDLDLVGVALRAPHKVSRCRSTRPVPARTAASFRWDATSWASDQTDGRSPGAGNGTRPGRRRRAAAHR
jgi:hypothetical protein